MSIEGIDVQESIEKVRRLLKEEKGVSPAIAAIMEVLILLVSLMASRLGRNSRNSHKPPSQDPNRVRKTAAGEVQKRKPGGQKDHKGVTLTKTSTPDAVEEIVIDRRTIPTDRTYRDGGYESRQVVDVKIKVHVTEYRAEVLEDEFGKCYVARFPEGVTKAIQYGSGVKAESVYLSQFQLIPLLRVQDHFADQMGLPLSKGSVSNFNQEAYERLEQCGYVAWAKKVTLYHPDEKRGKEAMDRMAILPFYAGWLCHDHWKSYYRYKNVIHVLCNAHHIRELKRLIEDDRHKWAEDLLQLLVELNDAVAAAGGSLSDEKITEATNRYREILDRGGGECPKPPPKEPGKRGRVKKTFSRNLLERLRDFKADTLRFMTEAIVPFTNNQGETDLRMTKVQQKISGCFRSMDGAKIFCCVRGFLSTCRKNNVSPTAALRDLFQGKLPEFMTS